MIDLIQTFHLIIHLQFMLNVLMTSPNCMVGYCLTYVEIITIIDEVISLRVCTSNMSVLLGYHVK